MAVERGLIGEDDEFEMVARNLETGESVPVARQRAPATATACTSDHRGAASKGHAPRTVTDLR
jgi:hypothetical protein